MSERLHSTARRNGLTLTTIVQGTWGLLLARYSDSHEAVFGTTVSGRPPELPGVESIIGMFINTIPTRVQTPGRQDTLTWLRDLQARQSQSRQFDFASLPQLQSWSDLPPGANLFNSMIVFENYPYDENSATQAGLHIRDTQVRDTTNFPLTLIAYLARQLHINLTYDPALFDTATADRHRRPPPAPAHRDRRRPRQARRASPLATPAERARPGRVERPGPGRAPARSRNC